MTALKQVSILSCCGITLHIVPYSQVVVHVHLSDRHPFKVGAHGIHLALIYRDTSIFDERVLCVVQFSLKALVMAQRPRSTSACDLPIHHDTRYLPPHGHPTPVSMETVDGSRRDPSRYGR